jgi:signal transduction histidine kinase
MAFADDGVVDERAREWLTKDVQAALDEVRAVGQGLYPPLLSEKGIAAAIQPIQRRTPVPLVIDGDGIGRYSPEVESAVYYCCLEAIQNATKHGGPGIEITVKLREDEDELRFDVDDDGNGFDTDLANGTGLQNMHDRLGAVGGRLTVRAAPGQGTSVTGRVPRSDGNDKSVFHEETSAQRYSRPWERSTR